MMLARECVGQQSWIAGDINLTQTSLSQKGKPSVCTTDSFQSTLKKSRFQAWLDQAESFVICLSISLNPLSSLLVVSARALTN